MGRIVVTEFVSLDGVMEAPGGEPGYAHTGWVFRYLDAAQADYKFREVVDAEALLIGRVTYESFAGAWPTYEGEFADRMNSMPKYVVSTTLRKPEWNNTTVLQGETIAAVTKLKQELGADILVAGSRALVNHLKRAGLVDEYRFMTFPLILGGGMRLFEETPDDLSLHFVSAQPFPNGAVVLTYRVES